MNKSRGQQQYIEDFIYKWKKIRIFLRAFNF